ncbi:hypothetical protein G6F46_000151 [Rhizopus delemar]|nr:hypothetical protein G6F46_000151 [Rhizopus delemar]
MYKPSKLDPAYDEWLKKAHSLVPPFDYFSFADLVLRDNRITNTLYTGILSKSMETSSKYLDESEKALKLFGSRSKKNSAFCGTYEAYWSKRKEDSAINSMRKRQLEGALNITNDIVLNMERIIKKSRITSSSTSVEAITNVAQTEEPYTSSSSEDETNGLLTTTKHVYRR